MTPPAYNMQAAYTYWYTTSPDVVLTNNSTSEDGMAKRASTSTATDSGFMGILSAERYNDGRAISNPKQRNLGGLKQASQSKSPTMDTGGVFGLSGGFEARQMPSNSNPSNSNSQSQKQTQHEQQRPSDADMGGRRRKKPKISDEEEEEEEEDEAAKKSRGRPRLDTKDETAADVCLYSFIASQFLSLIPLERNFRPSPQRRGNSVSQQLCGEISMRAKHQD
jgi:hypothetical protein